MGDFEGPRRAKHESWGSGVEAFADYVQKAFNTAVESAEAADIADLPPPTWKEVASMYAKLGGQMLEGRNYVLTLSPFRPLEIPPKLETGIFRASGPRVRTKVAANGDVEEGAS